MLKNTIKLVNKWGKELNSPTFLNVEQEDTYDVIPVTIKHDGEPSHVIEEGILAECFHLTSINFGNLYNNCIMCGEPVYLTEEDTSDNFRVEECAV